MWRDVVEDWWYLTARNGSRVQISDDSRDIGIPDDVFNRKRSMFYSKGLIFVLGCVSPLISQPYGPSAGLCLRLLRFFQIIRLRRIMEGFNFAAWRWLTRADQSTAPSFGELQKKCAKIEGKWMNETCWLQDLAKISNLFFAKWPQASRLWGLMVWWFLRYHFKHQAKHHQIYHAWTAFLMNWSNTTHLCIDSGLNH